MNDEEYTSIYNRYKMRPEEELKEITVENGYKEIAERVASDILHSDRTEYNQKLEEYDKMEKQRQRQKRLKEIAQQNNPLYDDIHQIAQDLHFIKNLIIVILILSVIVGIITGLSTI